MKELSDLVKSRANESNSAEELVGLVVGSSFDSEGNICDELIDHMIDFIKAAPEAGINDIFKHLIGILPEVEYVDDEESA
jgi:hypothetical protein